MSWWVAMWGYLAIKENGDPRGRRHDVKGLELSLAHVSQRCSVMGNPRAQGVGSVGEVRKNRPIFGKCIRLTGEQLSDTVGIADTVRVDESTLRDLHGRP